MYKTLIREKISDRLSGKLATTYRADLVSLRAANTSWTTKGKNHALEFISDVHISVYFALDHRRWSIHVCLSWVLNWF